MSTASAAPHALEWAHSGYVVSTNNQARAPCLCPAQEYRFRCRLTRALGAVAREARAFSQDLERQSAVPAAEAAAQQERLLGLLGQAGLLDGGGSGGDASGASSLGAAVKPEPVDFAATAPASAAPAAAAEAAAAAAALGRGPHVLADFLALLAEVPDVGAELEGEERGKVGGPGGWARRGWRAVLGVIRPGVR